MPAPHPNYPVLRQPHFRPSEEYQSVWMQHWGEALQYDSNDGRRLLVHSLLQEDTASVWILDDYARITDIIEGPRSERLQGYLLVGSPGIGTFPIIID